METKNENQIIFKEICKNNLWDIMKLNVAPDQRKFVAPNSVSIAEANYSDYAWMRGLYVNDEPVGFLMMADPITGEEGEQEEYNGRYFLWRFMVAENHQKKGYGKQALDKLCNYVRSRPNAEYLYASYHPGDHGPEKFYLNYGFEKTGEMLGDEAVIKVKL